MEKIFLIRNHEAERSFIQSRDRKKQLLSDAIDLCSKYVTITDEKEFSGGFIKYVDKQLRECSNLSKVKTDKLLNLFDIPVHKIKTLENLFTKIRIDLWGEMPDFDLYTESIDQVEQLKKVQSLCDSLNALGVRQEWMVIQRATQGIISFESGKWEPNFYAISNFTK